MLKDLLIRNRSYRRFDENHSVSPSILKELAELARLSPSAGNKQPLKYFLSSDPKMNQKIFPHLAWAGYLKEWPGPAVGERPTAYIIVLGDTSISPSFGCDHGIVAQSMLLGAVEKGLGGCMIASIDRPSLREALNLPELFEILLVIALGKPSETVILERVDDRENFRYWRDDKDRHHVPKRELEDIILE